MSSFNSSASRREFLRRAALLSAAGTTAPLALNLAALGNAAAQTVNDYKALVCIFLYGGNDAYNTVLATDSESWSRYTTVRNQAPDSIALRAVGTAPQLSATAGTPARLGGVLPINPVNAQGRSYALHPLLTRVRDLFSSGRIAIVPNVGPLLHPTSKALYKNAAHPKPAKLFSHNDQQSTWQSLGPEGTIAGWGGRMGDLLASNNSKATFTSISASGNAIWLSGQNVMQYQVSPKGAIHIGTVGKNTLFDSAGAYNHMRNVMGSARGTHVLERDFAAVVNRSFAAEADLTAALPPANVAPYGTAGLGVNAIDPLLQYDDPIDGVKAINPLAQQLQIVARMIGARTTLGAKRQVFFVSLNGFDTHDSQNVNQPTNMARLAHALKYFDTVLSAMGMANSVTTFTGSDFGRSFTSNGDGTDHGWGGHHFVMGGAVKGGDLYGTFPTYGLPIAGNDFSSPNQINNGIMLPETSVDQYGATLGRWFGISDAQLLDIFPSLAQFDASKRNLGFML